MGPAAHTPPLDDALRPSLGLARPKKEMEENPGQVNTYQASVLLTGTSERMASVRVWPSAWYSQSRSRPLWLEKIDRIMAPQVGQAVRPAPPLFRHAAKDVHGLELIQRRSRDDDRLSDEVGDLTAFIGFFKNCTVMEPGVAATQQLAVAAWSRLAHRVGSLAVAKLQLFFRPASAYSQVARPIIGRRAPGRADPPT